MDFRRHSVHFSLTDEGGHDSEVRRIWTASKGCAVGPQMRTKRALPYVPPAQLALDARAAWSVRRASAELCRRTRVRRSTLRWLERARHERTGPAFSRWRWPQRAGEGRRVHTRSRQRRRLLGRARLSRNLCGSRRSPRAVRWPGSHARLAGRSHARLAGRSHARLTGRSHARLTGRSHARLAVPRRTAF